MMKLETISELCSHLLTIRKKGQRIGFVPTMGALHEGHFSLIRAARADCPEVVVSIFVNPTQFAPGEDFQRYPRPLEADLAGCERCGVQTVFCPRAEEIYPSGCSSQVRVLGLTEGLCGAHRPGHFDGVTTVVAALFNIVQPDAAYFGQKDAQQCAVIRRMVRDLHWPIDVIICPTVREPDGLAMSSRNAYLSPEERRQALCLYRALSWASDAVRQGARDCASIIQEMNRQIESAGPCRVDYIEIVDADDLTPRRQIAGRCLIALAVHIGNARLIDNMLIEV